MAMLPLTGAIAVAFAVPAHNVKYTINLLIVEITQCEHIINPFLVYEITPILPSMPVAMAVSTIKVPRLTFAVVAL